jgi:hypothetical protein
MLESLSEILRNWVFSVRGAALTVFAALSAFFAAIIFFVYLIPVLWRLAKGLHGRHIAIVGSMDDYSEIKEALIASNLFRKNRITHIGLNSIDRVEKFSLIIFVWDQNKSKEVICRKKSDAALIIYAPAKSIDEDSLQKISKRPNTIIVNYRGRLVNDVFVCMMTTRELS